MCLQLAKCTYVRYVRARARVCVCVCVCVWIGKIGVYNFLCETLLFLLNIVFLLLLFSTLTILFVEVTFYTVYFFVVFFYFIYLLLDIFLHESDSKNDKASRYNFIKFHYHHPTRRRACAALSSLLYAASLVRREIGWVWSMKLTRYCHGSVLDMTFDNAR